MKVLNLSKGTRMISLANNDIIIRPESISKEFSCSTKLFRTLTSTKNYQNVFRFIMDASERSMLDLVPCISSLIISIQEAKDLLEFIHEGGVPAQLDIHGNIIASKIMPKKSVDHSDEPQMESSTVEDPEPEIDQDKEIDPQPMTDEEIAKMAELHKVEDEDLKPDTTAADEESADVDNTEDVEEEVEESKEESTHTSSSSSSSHQKKRRRRK